MPSDQTPTCSFIIMHCYVAFVIKTSAFIGTVLTYYNGLTSTMYHLKNKLLTYQPPTLSKKHGFFYQLNIGFDGSLPICIKQKTCMLSELISQSNESDLENFE